MGFWGDLLKDMAEYAVDELEKKANTISHDSRLSEEDQENYRDLSEQFRERKEGIRNNDVAGALGLQKSDDDDDDYDSEEDSEAEEYESDDNQEGEDDYKKGEFYYREQDDEDSALEWYLKAAEKGHAKAQAMAGCILYDSDCDEEAVKWLQKAAEQNIGLGQFYLAEAYQYGYGVPCDKDKALYWYKKAEDNGYPDAEEEVILLSDNEILDESEVARLKEEAETKGWIYMKGSDANKYLEIKRIEGSYEKGLQYEKGTAPGCDDGSDYEKAIDSYMLAARYGNMEAAYKIGNINYSKMHDVDNALRWYLKAAKQGHAGAQAMAGYILYDSDEEEAVEWLQKAAEQGDGAGQFYLADAYQYGNGVPCDIDKALYWYKKAEDNGYPGAEEQVILLSDKEVLDEAEVARLKEEAESKGWINMKVSDANKYLEIKRIEGSYEKGMQYEEGTAPDCDGPDYEKAMASYMLAAKYGNIEAAYRMGIIYQKWIFDEDKASQWYLKAAKQGHVMAKKKYKDIINRLGYDDEL